MTDVAGRSPAPVATAWPGESGPRSAMIRLHSSAIVGPPAAWMAPHTPPPGRRLAFAAFTMASTCSLVMSPRTRRMVRPAMLISGVSMGRLYRSMRRAPDRRDDGCVARLQVLPLGPRRRADQGDRYAAALGDCREFRVGRDERGLLGERRRDVEAVVHRVTLVECYRER